MNKIIQINLAGQAVSIDEQAYQKLSEYLKQLENHFASTPDGSEILGDIESRIAELFFSKLKKGNAFINDTDVTEAITLMGTPSDMGIEDEYEEQASNQTSSAKTSKKLFRDPNDRVLGGVCSGLAAYFGMDTSLMRVITILLVVFAGLPIFIYIILWAVLPEATSPQDRYRMYGDATTVNDIVDSVRNEAKGVASRVKNEASNVANNFKKNAKSYSSSGGVTNGLGQVIRFFGKIFGAAVLTGLVATAIALIVILLSNAAGGLDINWHGEEVTTPSLLKSPTLNWIFSISLLSLILIPIGTACYGILTYIFNSENYINLKAIFLAWLICLAVFIGTSIYSAGNLNVESFKTFGEEIRHNRNFHHTIEPVSPIEPLEPIEPIEPLEPLEPLESLEPLEPLEDWVYPDSI